MIPRDSVVYCTKCVKAVFLDNKVKRLLWRMSPVCTRCRKGRPPVGPFET